MAFPERSSISYIQAFPTFKHFLSIHSTFIQPCPERSFKNSFIQHSFNHHLIRHHNSSKCNLNSAAYFCPLPPSGLFFLYFG